MMMRLVMEVIREANYLLGVIMMDILALVVFLISHLTNHLREMVVLGGGEW